MFFHPLCNKRARKWWAISLTEAPDAVSKKRQKRRWILRIPSSILVREKKRRRRRNNDCSSPCKNNNVNPTQRLDIWRSAFWNYQAPFFKFTPAPFFVPVQNSIHCSSHSKDDLNLKVWTKVNQDSERSPPDRGLDHWAIMRLQPICNMKKMVIMKCKQNRLWLPIWTILLFYQLSWSPSDLGNMPG